MQIDTKRVPTPVAAGVLPGVRSRESRTDELIVGVSGVRRNATVAASIGGILTASCEQERFTRIRGIRLDPAVLPSEALEAVLTLSRRRASEVQSYAIAEDDARLPVSLRAVRIEHHQAHAASAFFTSPFERAAVIVCDRHITHPLSVWK